MIEAGGTAKGSASGDGATADIITHYTINIKIRYEHYFPIAPISNSTPNPNPKSFPKHQTPRNILFKSIESLQSHKAQKVRQFNCEIFNLRFKNTSNGIPTQLGITKQDSEQTTDR